MNNEENRDRLQKDLDELVNWADKWQLCFNAEKCHVLHMGHSNEHYFYQMRKHECEESVILTATES